jgi:hypothetical protein
MKAKRVVGVLAALLLCICMIMPVNTGSRENSKRGYQFLYRTKELLLCEWTEEEINKVSDF